MDWHVDQIAWVIEPEAGPEELLKFLPNKDLLSAIATVNASEATEAIVDDFMDIEGAASAVLGRGIGAVLAGAVAKVSGDFKLESLKKVVQNSDAAEKGFNNVKIKKL